MRCHFTFFYRHTFQGAPNNFIEWGQCLQIISRLTSHLFSLRLASRSLLQPVHPPIKPWCCIRVVRIYPPWCTHRSGVVFTFGVLKGVKYGVGLSPRPRKFSSSFVWKWYRPILVHFMHNAYNILPPLTGQIRNSSLWLHRHPCTSSCYAYVILCSPVFSKFTCVVFYNQWLLCPIQPLPIWHFFHREKLFTRSHYISARVIEPFL